MKNRPGISIVHGNIPARKGTYQRSSLFESFSKTLFLCVNFLQEIKEEKTTFDEEICAEDQSNYE